MLLIWTWAWATVDRLEFANFLRLRRPWPLELPHWAFTLSCGRDRQRSFGICSNLIKFLLTVCVREERQIFLFPMPKDNSSIIHSNWWSWPVPPTILPPAVQLLLLSVTATLPVLDWNVRDTKFHFWVFLFHLLFQYWSSLIWLQVVSPFLSRSSLLADSITNSCFCGFERTPISISIATLESPLLSFLRLRCHSNAVLPFLIRSNSLSARSQ